MYKSLEQNENEIWKDIKGYEGLYQVSNTGRVKSFERTVVGRNGSKRTIRERILRPTPTRDGYLRVNLYDSSGKRKFFFVHRLVSEAFIKNPKKKSCVNHIDEDKTNNTASNLEWCNYEENNNHGTRNARSAKAQSKSVGQYTRDGELIKIWQSAHEVKRRLGFDQSAVSKAARGKYKTAYGYVWKYVD